MSERRSVLAHPALLYGAASAAALLSALGQQAIAQGWGDGWDWVKFGQDVLSNGIITIILAVAAHALQKEQERAKADRLAIKRKAAEDEETRRRENAERGRLLGLVALPLAVNGWSNVPPEPGTTPVQQTLTPELLKDLAGRAKTWRDIAQHLDELRDSRPPVGASDEDRHQQGMFAHAWLSALQPKLQLYIMEGGRHRRLIYLQWLANDLATAASAGWSWSPAVYRFRNAAVVLFGWVQHTDTTIVERLLVERFNSLVNSSSPPPANMWRDTPDASLADPAVAADTLYLLLFHINYACARITETQQFADAIPLVDLVERSLGALRNELRAAAECSDALLAIAQEALETDPSTTSRP